MKIEIILTGPAACGKSHMAQLLADFLDNHTLKGTYYEVKTKRYPADRPRTEKVGYK